MRHRDVAVILATGGMGRLHVQGFPCTNHYGATADGLVITGCNVENSSYPAGTCAERVALEAACAAAQPENEVVVVDDGSPDPLAPLAAERGQSIVLDAPGGTRLRVRGFVRCSGHAKVNAAVQAFEFIGLPEPDREKIQQLLEVTDAK